MVTEEKFKTYLNVQKTGLTNMFNLNAIVFISIEVFEVRLTQSDCLFIMEHYSQLREEYERGREYEYGTENFQYRSGAK